MIEVAIIGSGASGMTSAIHSAFEGLNTVVYSKDIGGQAATTSDIQNYPGYEHIDGYSLMQAFYRQTQRLHVAYKMQEVKRIEDIAAKVTIVASGLSFRDFPIADKFLGKGVYYGPSMHVAPEYWLDTVAVLGGANSAGQAVLHLSKHARKVYLINKHATLETSMSSTLCKEIYKHSNVEILNNAKVDDIDGRTHLEDVWVSTPNTDYRLKSHGLFICIGQYPVTDWLPVQKDSSGHVIVDSSFRTSMKGVFAIGDVTSQHQHRIAIAVGDGAKVIADGVLPFLKTGTWKN